MFFTLFLSFRRYNYVAVWLAALAVGLHEFISLQCRVDDSSLIRIHRLKCHRSSVSLYLMCNVLCKVSQSLFPSCTIVLCVKLYSYITFLLAAGHSIQHTE